MKQITVAAMKSDPRSVGIQKYDRNIQDIAYVRATAPDARRLEPLAAWLVEHVPSSVRGRGMTMVQADRVICYNGKTQADVMREQNPGRRTESNIRMYGLEAKPATIEYLFPIIKPGQTDEDYWNKTAAAILAAGINRIVIGDAEWRAQA